MNFWDELNKPFTVLAPMEEVTDVVFREIVAMTARPDVFFTEFTNVEGLCSKGRDEVQKSLLFTLNQHPIVVQIWGLKPECFFQAAQMISQMGFEGIDINLGCPIRRITRKGACAGMIGNFEAVKNIIQAVKEGGKGLPISIKTRLGIETIMTEEWVTFLLEQGIEALTIHGRIATQMSTGQANWEEIGKAVIIRNKIAPETKIIGNGDIKSYTQVMEMHQKYGVDGVMVGRGIMANPWMFDKNETTHTASEYLQLLEKHLRLFETIWGTDGRFVLMKKFFSMYIQGYPGAKNFRLDLMKAKSCQEALEILSGRGEEN